jgi:hypothetical protein
MMTDNVRIKIPESGVAGLKALISLGPDGIDALCEIANDLPLSLDVSSLIERISKALEKDPRIVSRLVTAALMPLNHLRVDMKLESHEFLDVISRAIESDNHQNWDPEQLNGWRAIVSRVGPLFGKDNIFSLTSKSYQLLINRPNPVQSIKILSEVRPVYGEDATSIKAFVLAKTLVVDYAEKETAKTIFLSMDMDDLRSLATEVDRARLKSETISDAMSEWGVELLTYGQQG